MTEPGLETWPLGDARRELLASADRWRLELAEGDPARSTAWFGVGARSMLLAEVLLRGAVELVVPAQEAKEGLTLGQRVDLLIRFGRGTKMRCTRRPRNLVTPREIKVLNRLTKNRNFIAHNADRRSFDPKAVGRLARDEVLDFVDLAEEVARLAMFDELECLLRPAVNS